MNIEDFRNHCLKKKGVTETFPFGPGTGVYKVCDKIFVLADIDVFNSFNVKCDPEEAVSLREKYSAVLPGYHMNKKHWNTILNDGSVSDKILFQWIDISYQLVLNGVSKKDKLRWGID